MATRRSQTLARRAQRWGMRATWFVRPLPDIVVLGAMKAGTTSAYMYLREHPDVRVSVRKEVHYLDMHSDRGPRWYRGQFPARLASDFVAVEATPMYLSWPPAPDLFGELDHDARFVVLLRDPVDRAISQWKHRTRDGREHRSLGHVIDDESRLSGNDLAAVAASGIADYQQLVLVHGHYAEQLTRWFSRFERERFLVLESVDLFGDPQSAIDKICDFAGLPRHMLRNSRPFNAGDARGASPSDVDALADYYAGRNEQLYELLGRRMDWQRPSTDAGHPR